MVSRLIVLVLSPPPPSFSFLARPLPWSPTSVIECLEERTLLSASLPVQRGSYAGSSKGTDTVNNNGQISTDHSKPAAVQASIVNGVVSTSISGGTGTGIVGSNGVLSGTVNTTINGQCGRRFRLRELLRPRIPDDPGLPRTWSFSTNLGAA